MPLSVFSSINSSVTKPSRLIYSASSKALPNAITSSNIVAWYNPYYITWSGTTGNSAITNWQNTKNIGTMDLNNNSTGSGTNYSLNTYSGSTDAVSGLQMIVSPGGTNNNYLQSTNTSLIGGFVCFCYPQLTLGNQTNSTLWNPYGCTSANAIYFRWGTDTTPFPIGNANDIVGQGASGGMVNVNGTTQYQNGGYVSNWNQTNKYTIYYCKAGTTNVFSNNWVYNSTQSYTAFGIGSGYTNTSFTGYMGDYIFLGPNHTYADAQACEGYLAWKWGVVSSLPYMHPWKYSRPT